MGDQIIVISLGRATFAAPLRGRDPGDITVGELMSYPALSANVMLSRLLSHTTTDNQSDPAQ